VSTEFGLLLITGNHTHQENYARAFAADPRCRLIGLTDDADVSPRRRQLNQDLADELDIPCFDDLHAAIHRDDVDLVSICAEPERRRDLTIACAAAGKHLYVDKDPAPTVADAWEIANAAKEHGVLTQAFSLVRLPACQRARAVIESGQLGELVGLHCDVTFAKGVGGTADLSRPRVESATAERFTFTDSKREFLCCGYYALVLFQWLTGKRFTSVDATTANYFFAEHQKNDVEDFASVMLGMEDGVETTITAGRCGWMSHRSYGIHEIRLIGTQGSATIDAHQPRLEVCSDAAPWSQPAEPHPEDPMGFWSSTQKSGGVLPKEDWWLLESVSRSDAACFLDCLEQNQSSDVPADMAAHCVDVVHAVYASAATGETVVLDHEQVQQ
jgi:predicted dehydrogenase